MAEENNQEEQGLDDWAAALAEQEQSEASTNANAEEELKALPASESTDATAAIFNRLDDAPAQDDKAPTGIDMVLDIPVTLSVELGRTKIAIRSLLQLAQGSVVELEGLAGEPMDVLVNGCLIAQGEVVVVNDKFGIRLTDIITPGERVRRLQK